MLTSVKAHPGSQCSLFSFFVAVALRNYSTAMYQIWASVYSTVQSTGTLLFYTDSRYGNILSGNTWAEISRSRCNPDPLSHGQINTKQCVKGHSFHELSISLDKMIWNPSDREFLRDSTCKVILDCMFDIQLIQNLHEPYWETPVHVQARNEQYVIPMHHSFLVHRHLLWSLSSCETSLKT